MKNLCILNDALSYIEENISSDIDQNDIAAHCYCSLSALQKLFRYAFNFGVGNYVTRRRMTCSARELVTTDENILDIAMKYGYGSAEAFTRAFSKAWGETPAAFRKNKRFPGMFPKLEFDTDKGGIIMNEMHRKYDVTELYDYLKANTGTYIIGFDIKGLIPINEISNRAGDAAIRESLRRIDEAAGEGMLLLRIGGDEFALATGSADEAVSDSIIEKVISRNGEEFSYEGRMIPLSLYATKVKMSSTNLRYSQLFPEIYNALEDSKR